VLAPLPPPLAKQAAKTKNLRHSGVKLAKNFLSLLLARVNKKKRKGVEKMTDIKEVAGCFPLILIVSAVTVCSCYNASAHIELKPELSTDDKEIYQINGRGNAFASWDELYNEMKKEAANKSNSEGKDCFVLLTHFKLTKEV
jgi:hypothetical protein